MLTKFKKSLAANLALCLILVYSIGLAGDLVVTGSNVFVSATSTGRRVSTATAAVALTAGQGVYTGTDGKAYLLSGTTANTIAGITINAAAAGQPVTYVTYDPAFRPGCTLNPGDIICTGTGPGGITLSANVSGTANHGTYVTVLGVCTGTTSGTSTVSLNFISSGTPTP